MRIGLIVDGKELTPTGYGVHDTAEGAEESVPPQGGGAAFAPWDPCEHVVKMFQTGGREVDGKLQGVHNPSQNFLPRCPGRVAPPQFLQEVWLLPCAIVGVIRPGNTIDSVENVSPRGCPKRRSALREVAEVVNVCIKVTSEAGGFNR